MKIKTIKTLLSIATLSAITGTAWAGGTDAGTSIDNTATISYSVSGSAQPVIGSSPTGNTSGAGTPTTFTVDKKIDLQVTAGSAVNVSPNTTGATITFTLENQGNSTEDFLLSQTHITGAGDDFDATACNITTPSASTISLAKDATQNIVVTCNIPSSANNTETSKIDLNATAVDGSGNPLVATTGADTAINTAGNEDIVLADDDASATDPLTSDTAVNNSEHSAVNTFTVTGAAANLTVTKTSAVTEDPINGVSANAKRIPGATIEYTITVSNADGATDATNLVITDILQGDLTFVSCSVAGAALGTPTCSNSAGTVTTSSFTLPGGSGAANVETLTIIATVN